MAANTTPLFTLTPKNGGQTFVNADSTNLKTLITAGDYGFRLDSISITSDDTSARNIAFYVSVGGTDYYIGNVPVVIGAGYGAVPKVDGMSFLKPAALDFLVIPAGALLKCNMVVAVTAAKVVTVVAIGGDF